MQWTYDIIRFFRRLQYVMQLRIALICTSICRDLSSRFKLLLRSCCDIILSNYVLSWKYITFLTQTILFLCSSLYLLHHVMARTHRISRFVDKMDDVLNWIYEPSYRPVSRHFNYDVMIIHASDIRQMALRSLVLYDH